MIQADFCSLCDQDLCSLRICGTCFPAEFANGADKKYQLETLFPDNSLVIPKVRR
jgi:hypothetical protein